MPVYEYVCQKCNHEWSVTMSLSEHEKKPKQPCPKCNSRKVRQKLSSFLAVTSKKT